MNSKLFQAIFYGYRLALFPLVKTSARLPLAQASIESAGFTSNIFKSLNNMFGMNQYKARKGKSLGAGASGFATYASPADSILDYLYWLEAMGLTDDAALERHLAAGKYATDPKYFQKVTAKANELQPLLISPTAFVAGTAAALVATAAAGIVVAKVLK